MADEVKPLTHDDVPVKTAVEDSKADSESVRKDSKEDDVEAVKLIPAAAGDNAANSDVDEITKAFSKMELTPRPNVGRCGRPIGVHANFFQILLQDPNLAVHQYHAEIHHPGMRTLDREEARLIFWKVVEAHRTIFISPFAVAYDGGHQMYTPNKLPCGNNAKLNAEVVLVRDSPYPTQCAVTFTYTGTIFMKDLSRSQRAPSNGTMAPLQVLDIVIRQALTCPLYEKASQFYSWKSSCYILPGQGHPPLNLDGGKEMWTGFFTSAVITSDWKPLLNVDVSHSAFYKSRIAVVDFLIELMNERSGYFVSSSSSSTRSQNSGGRFDSRTTSRDRSGSGGYCINPSTQLSHSEIRILEEAIKGMRVRSNYNEKLAIRVYRVNGVKGPANAMSFTTRDENGNEFSTTVADYFARRYRSLKYPNLPCLHVGPPSRNILLPLEVCILDSPQKFTKKLTDRQTSTVIKASAVDATQRENKINALCNKAGFLDDPFMDSFGVRIDTRMVTAHGRVLDAPKIQFSANSRDYVQPRDGVWPCERQRLFMPGQCHSYALIAICDPREQPQLEKFSHVLACSAREMGLTWPDWPDVVNFARNGSELPALFENVSREYQRVRRTCDLIVVIMPGKNNDLYMTIKELSDMKYGIMSQCVQMRGVHRPTASYVSNLLLKINMKLGGINSRLVADNITAKYLIDRPVLVLGIDVTHPTQLEDSMGMPSVAAVVGNIDMLPQNFGANVKVQRRCRESVVYVTDAVKERIQAFHRATSRYPERMLVYRDGVSEGQFSEVLREELNGIRAACTMIASDYMPKITYVVVQKRHHARIFCNDIRDSVGKAKNIPPGTVVDSEIVSPESFDFYLCSHFGIQGTSRPSRYHVLYDDNKFTADELQAITYNLCFTYGRCCRSVSIPSPVYYADLVATRARTHLKRQLQNHARESSKCSTSSLSRTQLSSSQSNSGNKNIAQKRPQRNQELSDSIMQNFVSVQNNIRDRMYFV